MHLLIIFLILTSSLFAERITIDPLARSFQARTPRKERVDVYDFNGAYPELENIDIDAKRKKNVEFYLTGDYPSLESLNYEGTFGQLTGDLRGNFPQLSLVNFLCTSCAMQLNLAAEWSKSCSINIRGMDEDVVLNLPKDVGVVVHTRVGLKGKVIVNDDLKKKGKLRILNKTYVNPLAQTSPVVLIINVEVGDGRIILN